MKKSLFVSITSGLSENWSRTSFPIDSLLQEFKLFFINSMLQVGSGRSQRLQEKQDNMDFVSVPAPPVVISLLLDIGGDHVDGGNLTTSLYLTCCLYGFLSWFRMFTCN